jgi:hypothetical protein
MPQRDTKDKENVFGRGSPYVSNPYNSTLKCAVEKDGIALPAARNDRIGAFSGEKKVVY